MNLLRIPHDRLSPTLRTVALEVELALEMEVPHFLALPTHSSSIMLHTADRMTQYNKFGLFLDDFPAGRVPEKDYSLLAAKLLENPDFPVVPPWHEEFSTLRPWFNVALELPEDVNSDIFAHEVLLNKVFHYFNKYAVAPPTQKLCAFRWAATKEAQKMMEAEAEAAALL
jgi:hypothetical protein